MLLEPPPQALSLLAVARSAIVGRAFDLGGAAPGGGERVDQWLLVLQHTPEAVLASFGGLPVRPEPLAQRALRLIAAARAAPLAQDLGAWPGLIHEARLGGDEALLTLIVAEAGRAYGRRWDQGRARALLSEAAERAERLGCRHLYPLVVGNLGAIHGQQGRYSAWADLSGRAMHLYQRVDDTAGALIALASLVSARGAEGRSADATALLHAARSRFPRRGRPGPEPGGLCAPLRARAPDPRGPLLYPWALLLAAAAVEEARAGEGEAAEAHHRAAEDALLGRGWVVAHGAMTPRWARAMREAGRFAAATAAAERALHSAISARAPALAAEIHELLALIALDAGRPEAAAASALRALASSREVLRELHLRGEAEVSREAAAPDALRAAREERDRRVAAEAESAKLAARLEAAELSSERLRQAAYTDALTGLPNRRALEERLLSWTSADRRPPRQFAVAIFDADHFKAINDTHGHDVGDEVLRELGRRLRARVRSGDLVGRWGGEEFCALLCDLSAEAAPSVLEGLRAAAATAPFQTRVGPLHLSLSAGAALASGEGADSPDTLLMAADLALYAAKAAGRARLCFAEPPGRTAG